MTRPLLLALALTRAVALLDSPGLRGTISEAAEPAGLEALPLVGGAFAARRAFAEAEETQLLKSKQRFFDQYFPNGVADGAAAHFEPRGTMSLKVTNGAGIMATTSYHILGTYSAEPLD